MVLPWWMRFTPHPDSLPAGEAHHRSWKFGLPAAAPSSHVGTGLANTWRVIGFDCETPFTVYAKVPLFPSVNVKVALPTGFTETGKEPKASLKAGPVVRKSWPVHALVPLFWPFDITSHSPLWFES